MRFLSALALSAAKTLANCNALFHQQICGGLEALCVITTVISDFVLPLPSMSCRSLTRLRAPSLLIWQVSAFGLSHISILRDTREGYIDNLEINCL